ncbi:VOC family protein [Sphingomonadaceae bacterium jetA1]|uniref:VOC family protein n=1 Tax=Facivitalis istanbulensis TaxID=3075838 RepID=UPI0034948953
MSKLEVAMLGHVALEVPDLEGSIKFWRDIVGLIETDRRGNEVYLRGWGEFEHHSMVLIQGKEARLHHVGWKARSAEDLDKFATYLRGQGVTVDEVPAGTELGQGEAIRFFVPTSGHPMEIYWDMERPLAPEEIRSLLKSQSAQARLRGVSPRRIDHVNLWCGQTSPDDTIAWMSEHLGFKVREYIQLPDLKLGAWMSVTPLVHDVAFMFDPATRGARLHHIGYWIDTPQDILHALGHFAEHGIRADLGPGMHGITQAFYSYIRDPSSGHLLEIFSGGYLIFDPAWEPIKWEAQELERGLFWYGDSMDPTTEPEHPFARTTGARTE